VALIYSHMPCSFHETICYHDKWQKRRECLYSGRKDKMYTSTGYTRYRFTLHSGHDVNPC